MRRSMFWFPVCAALLAGSPARAAENCFVVDKAGGAVTFKVNQAGNPFHGSFRSFGGNVCYEGARISRIEVWLDPASVDGGLPEIDAALKDKEFFAVREFPKITFTSASVTVKGDAHQARGALEIKGKRRDVDISFRVRQEGGRRTASGSFALDRLQYGIGTGEWSNTSWLGAEVQVEFKAALAGGK